MVAEADGAEHLLDPRPDLTPRQSLALQPVRDVPGHGHVGEQRVRLEHQVDRAAVRRARQQVGAVERDRAAVGRLDPGEDAQQRGLAAAARAEEGEELALADVQGDAVQGDDVTEPPGDALDAHKRLGYGGRLGKSTHVKDSVSRVIRWATMITVKLTASRIVASALISGVTPKRTIE